MNQNNDERVEKLQHEIEQEKKEVHAIEDVLKKEKVELHHLEDELKELQEKESEQKTLIVNGMPKVWDKKKINLQEVITLAYGTYHPDWTNTVAFEDGPKENPDGSLELGQEIFVKNKMIFHATATFNS